MCLCYMLSCPTGRSYCTGSSSQDNTFLNQNFKTDCSTSVLCVYFELLNNLDLNIYNIYIYNYIYIYIYIQGVSENTLQIWFLKLWILNALFIHQKLRLPSPPHLHLLLLIFLLFLLYLCLLNYSFHDVMKYLFLAMLSIIFAFLWFKLLPSSPQGLINKIFCCKICM